MVSSKIWRLVSLHTSVHFQTVVKSTNLILVFIPIYCPMDPGVAMQGQGLEPRISPRGADRQLKPSLFTKVLSRSVNFIMSLWMTVSSKLSTKLFLDFCPEFFVASWGLPGDLVFNIINKEAYRKSQKASRKPQGRYKKFQGRNPEIISLVFLSKQ